MTSPVIFNFSCKTSRLLQVSTFLANILKSCVMINHRKKLQIRCHYDKVSASVFRQVQAPRRCLEEAVHSVRITRQTTTLPSLSLHDAVSLCITQPQSLTLSLLQRRYPGVASTTQCLSLAVSASLSPATKVPRRCLYNTFSFNVIYDDIYIVYTLFVYHLLSSINLYNVYTS